MREKEKTQENNNDEDNNNNNNNNNDNNSESQESSQGDDQWEVEKILKKKKIDGIMKYFVKWVGFPHDQNTWEPIDHLENVRYMVDEFNRQESEKEKNKLNTSN